ncbi:MAG: hypothetical protein IKB70_14130 [Bacilli bacterium]|nr:hypothetical protein [Bacilli bacterium]
MALKLWHNGDATMISGLGMLRSLITDRTSFTFPKLTLIQWSSNGCVISNV